MEVVKITPRGYCHGVVDAIRIARRVGRESDEPVHMLGYLVHNTHVTDELQGDRVGLVDATVKVQLVVQVLIVTLPVAVVPSLKFATNVNDLPAMSKVGLPVAVADAAPQVRKAARWVTSRRGGDAAVREVCDALLAAR